MFMRARVPIYNGSQSLEMTKRYNYTTPLEKTAQSAFYALRNHKEVTTIWNRINNTAIWECATCCFNRWQPDTMEEFKVQYESHKNHKELINHYATVLRDNDPFKQQHSVYYWFIIYHLIVETFRGCQREKQIEEYLQHNGFEVVHGDDEDDIYCGIDLIASNDACSYALQVKPISFFRGNNNQGLIEDRKRAFQKEQNTLDKYGIPTYYIIYNGDELVRNSKGKLCHRLKDLITRDGKTKIDINQEINDISKLTHQN